MSELTDKEKRSVDITWVLFVLSAMGLIGLGIFGLFSAEDLPQGLPIFATIDAWSWLWIIAGTLQLIGAVLLSRRAMLGRMLGLTLAASLVLLWIFLLPYLRVQAIIFIVLNALAFVQLVRRGSLFTV